ncbi:MAG: NAD(P)/FAD-dependent oxidoreductase [Candidatus Sumerlaeaceae bacterium]
MNQDEFAPQTAFGFPSLSQPDVYDVAIIGGGPAGMSSALVLARCRRKVLVVDAGEPRNRFSLAMHGFLSREGMPPLQFSRLCREELLRYPTVTWKDGRVVDVIRTPENCFVTVMNDGINYLSRKMLLATGVIDEIPQIPGIEQFYGISVHHCPYCDGYEWRDKRIVVYGKCDVGFCSVQELTAWSRNLVLCTDGPCEIDDGRLQYLDGLRIAVRQECIARLEGEGGHLQRIVFVNGDVLECDALFFVTGQHLAHKLAEKLGCTITEKGCVWTGDCEQTEVEGLYCAGDASRNAQMVIIAAAEGAQAAVAINISLTGQYKEAKKKQLSP